MTVAAEIIRHLEGLTVGQGRYAGEPFRVLGWQSRFLRVFNGPGDGALSMARGNGKSVFVAAVASAAVDVGGPLVEKMGATIAIASSFDQAKEAIFDHLLHFLSPSFGRYGTGAKGRFRVQDSGNRAQVTDRETGASVRVLGADPKRGHGLQPRLIIADEPSQWDPAKRDRMLTALRTSRGKIPNSKMLWLGTRPADSSHPFQRALDGHGVALALSYQAGKDDPPFHRATWLKSNPSLRYGFPDLEAVIREEADDAKRDPDSLAGFKALRLNQGVSDVHRAMLLDAEAWRRITVSTEDAGSKRGGHVLGVDLGSGAAMSAVSAYFPDGRLEVVACFPELPTLAECGLADGVGRLYVSMSDRGELIQHGRRVADVKALLMEVLDRWGRPVALVCDRWREAELRDACESVRFPLAAVVVRGQGFKDGAEDVRCFRKAVLGRHVRATESLLMASAIAEARIVMDSARNAKLSKGSEGGHRQRARDDAIAAAILAVASGYRQWHAKPKRRTGYRSAIL